MSLESVRNGDSTSTSKSFLNVQLLGSGEFHNILVIFFHFFPGICFCLLLETGYGTRQAFGLIWHSCSDALSDKTHCSSLWKIFFFFLLNIPRNSHEWVLYFFASVFESLSLDHHILNAKEYCSFWLNYTVLLFIKSTIRP